MGTFAAYVGNFSIAEEKRKEFNENMLKLLQLGGMVQFNKVNLYNKEIALIYPVEFNEEGKCNFGYNYFEDDFWETAGFCGETNVLWSGKIGSFEFNSVICAGYFLTELYSEEPGLVEIDGRIINSPEYIQWINFILDKDFSMKNRFDLWRHYESLCISRLENGYTASELDWNEILDIVPIGYETYMGGTELADILYITYGTNDSMEDAPKSSYAAEIVSLRKKLEDFYHEYPKVGQKDIWSMLFLSKEKRECISGTRYDELAKISLRVPARVFLYLSAELLEFSFWDEWQKIYKDVYRDELKVSYVSEEVTEKRVKMQSASLGKMKTSMFLKNSDYFAFYDTPEEIKYKGNYYISDDDLMYWWDGTGKIVLSAKMVDQIIRWKKDYDEIVLRIKYEDLENYDMLKNLIFTLDKANQYYERIFAFSSMFYEFLENNKDIRYIAAIKLLEKVIEDNKEEGKIIEKRKGSWGITSKNVTFNEGRVNIKRFLSIMANIMLRKHYFSF